MKDLNLLSSVHQLLKDGLFNWSSPLTLATIQLVLWLMKHSYQPT